MAITLATINASAPDGIVVDGYIDQGGQGAVFRGTVDGVAAAIKLFRPDSDPRRLERELQLLSSIDCATLVKVIRSTTIRVDSVAYPVVAYEYLDGGDLRQLVKNGPTDYSRVLRIAADVAAGIDALWAARIVHRDIKPGNIVASSAQRHVLVDVGFARHVDRSDITAPGGAPGTYGYKSPEQAAGRRHLTVHSDVFSLGVTLYELAAGKHPYNHAQPGIGSPMPTDLTRLRSDLPRPFARLVSEMLRPNPSARPSRPINQIKVLMDG